MLRIHAKKALQKNLGISKTIMVPKRQAKELTLIRLGFLKVVFFCEGINLTNPKKQGFTPSLENAVLEKPQGGNRIAPSLFRVNIQIANKNFLLFGLLTAYFGLLSRAEASLNRC